MQIDRRTIEANLPKKGFIREDTHDRYFYHEYQGKRTGPFTYTSSGNNYKTYGWTLIKRMKKELRLDSNREVVDLCTCPMSGEDFNERLKQKGSLR